MATWPIPDSDRPVGPETMNHWLADGLAHLAFKGHAVLYDGGRRHPLTIEEWQSLHCPTAESLHWLTLQQAADPAKKSPGTIRHWCEGEGLGRRIGGKWCVSKVKTLQVRVPKPFIDELDEATRRMVNRTDYIRMALQDCLRADGIDLTPH